MEFEPEYKTNSQWGWWLLTIITIIWLLWLTLRPDRTLNGINLIPLVEHTRAAACLLDSGCIFQHRSFQFLLIDVVGNIILFIPLGVGLTGLLYKNNLWQAVRRVALGGFILSLFIELTQLTIPTRATDVDDLIFNTLGTTLGVLFFALSYKLKLLLEETSH